MRVWSRMGASAALRMEKMDRRCHHRRGEVPGTGAGAGGQAGEEGVVEVRGGEDVQPAPRTLAGERVAGVALGLQCWS